MRKGFRTSLVVKAYCFKAVRVNDKTTIDIKTVKYKIKKKSLDATSCRGVSGLIYPSMSSRGYRKS